MIPIPQISHANSIMFVVILFSICFIGFLRAYYWKHTKLILLAPFQYRYASQYLRQDNAFTERVNCFIFLSLLINLSLLIDINPIISAYFNEFIYVLLFLLIFYILKFLVLKFLGKLLFIEEIIKNSTAKHSNYDIIACDLPWFGEMAEKGRFLPLDNLISNTGFDTSDFHSEALASARYKGNQYGVPVQTTPDLLVYRRDLFESKGLKAPHTIDDTLIAAQKRANIFE